MKKLEQYIDTNFNEFNELSISEVIHYDADDFDVDMVNYLKQNYRFDYRGICIYYVLVDNEVYIENMNWFLYAPAHVCCVEKVFKVIFAL